MGAKDIKQSSDKLVSALMVGDADEALQATKQLLEGGEKPMDVINFLIIPALTEVGEKFEKFEIYIPELMLAGKAAEEATSLLEEEMKKTGSPTEKKATIMLGSVQGDIHDLGKNIVGSLLGSKGYKIIDLGRDVPPETFLEQAEVSSPDIIGLSALMTTTLPAMKQTISLFTEVGLRDKYKIIIGGGAVTQELSDNFGADGFASDAGAAIRLVDNLVLG